MATFDHPDFDHHELVAFKEDKAAGLRAIIAVHNTHLGPALGGCRMYAYDSHDQALSDVLRLSRGMTFKSALAGLPLGGGKAVIIGDPRTGKDRKLLLAMGRFVESLSGQYLTAEDSGTDLSDMAVIAENTRYVSGFTVGKNDARDPSPATAYGVYCGIKVAVKHRMNQELSGVRIGVIGVGKVGYQLARLLVADGAQVLVADRDKRSSDKAVAELGVKALACGEIVAADIDVLAPCALGGCVNAGSIEKIRAKIIAGSANNQLADPQLGDALMARGILYAPDYVINAGGVIDVYFQSRGVQSGREVRAHIDKIADTLGTIFQRSLSLGVATSDIADRMAEEALFSGKREFAIL